MEASSVKGRARKFCEQNCRFGKYIDQPPPVPFMQAARNHFIVLERVGSSQGFASDSNIP